MFIAIPLENKPSWQSPPWMTVLLIVINCLVFWVWQEGEERGAERAAKTYAHTALPAIEVPEFVKYLDAQSQNKDSRINKQLVRMAQGLQKSHDYEQLYTLMWQEGRFRSQLLAGEVIRPGDPTYAEWQAARARFAPQEPKPFTSRWAMSYEPGAGLQPVQAFTSTFLHGSTGHLVGNMVFLFLFGFTLEMALGAGLYLCFYVICGVSASLFAGLFYAGMGSYGLGASGAIAGLMAMYVVLYRMRRIRFFYMLAFYFNYATWPALVLLPVWMGFELAQHWIGGRGVAYMAHFGGLLAGGILMALYLQLRRKESVVEEAARDKQAAKVQADALQAAVQRARMPRFCAPGSRARAMPLPAMIFIWPRAPSSSCPPRPRPSVSCSIAAGVCTASVPSQCRASAATRSMRWYWALYAWANGTTPKNCASSWKKLSTIRNGPALWHCWPTAWRKPAAWTMRGDGYPRCSWPLPTSR